MGFGTHLIIIIVIWVAASMFFQFYTLFHTRPCPPGARRDKCLHPLFADGEPVNIFAFLTGDAKLKWWTQGGLDTLRSALLWNITSVPYGQSIDELRVTVPLSNPLLHGIRLNETSLHVHCFLLRSTADLDAELRRPEPHKDRSTSRVPVVVTSNLLHTQAPLTKLRTEAVRQRRNLLDSSDEQDQNRTIESRLPLLGILVKVSPAEAMMWTGSVCLISMFATPNLALGVLRHSAHVLVLPWLWNLRSTLQARKWQAKLQQESLWQWDQQLQVPHLVPIVKISLAVDTNSYDAKVDAPLLYKEMVFGEQSPMPLGERDVRYELVKHDKELRYAAPFAIDVFGLPQRGWRALDSNLSRPDPEVPLELSAEATMKFTVVQTVRESMKMYMRMGFSERDFEDFKDFFFRYPLHIMALMQVIGFLQMTLTTLAFKNDISFFRGRSDYTGLSSRSLGTDTIHEFIIFLYLFDFDDISRLILFQVGTSSLIGAWKYVRVARLSVSWQYLVPWVRTTRGQGENSAELATEDIDAKGMRYLTYLLYPLSACWGIYNLYHYSYKSWWSWLVSSLADFAYTFGFINMMPQIFINYKLKSVAHMPWRVLMYKFFNTFIDDVFAFCIMSDYMTKKHRYMTLRDDIVFFVFLYQRWIYPVDSSRPDEFGYVYEEAQADTAAAKPVEDASERSTPLPEVLKEQEGTQTTMTEPSSCQHKDAAAAQLVDGTDESGLRERKPASETCDN